MEGALQLIIQCGALGLLAYLILWTTREGAPKLFAHLGNIAVALQSTSTRLAALEEQVKALQGQVKKLVGE